MKNLFTQRNLIIVLAAVLGFFGFLVALDYGLKEYNQWKGEQGVENLKMALEKIEEEDYKLALADTYGGKTPEETLDMFIAALEKGDYELASRYFVIEKQKEWENGLFKTKTANKINFFLEKIKETKKNIDGGQYSEEKDWFRVEKPVSIEFMLYPNGIWKIREI